jgi:Sulfotransferase family
MDEITPVFICGMGRSGTTNALRVLNTHPSVMLNGEISLSVLKNFFALIDGVDRSYGTKDETSAGWSTRKAEYMFESFGYLAKGGRGRMTKVPDAKFRGHKTPRLENLFDKYELHFGSIGPKPRYFYCARNPFDCWRSYKTAGWSDYASVEEFLKYYAASYEKLEQMRDLADDRVQVLNLDELVATPDPLAWYRENVFAPLVLDVSENIVPRIEYVTSKRNAAPPSSTLSADDRSTIARYPGIAELVERLFPRAMPSLR